MLDNPEVLAKVTEQPRFLPWEFDTNMLSFFQVNALALALGAKPSVLGRADNVSEFIRLIYIQIFIFIFSNLPSSWIASCVGTVDMVIAWELHSCSSHTAQPQACLDPQTLSMTTPTNINHVGLGTSYLFCLYLEG